MTWSGYSGYHGSVSQVNGDWPENAHRPAHLPPQENCSCVWCAQKRTNESTGMGPITTYIIPGVPTMDCVRGKGFIVVDGSQFRAEEYTDVDDAQNEAGVIAHRSGIAIVYAPIAVIRPRRETMATVPSDLLKQVSRVLPAGARVMDRPEATADDNG